MIAYGLVRNRPEALRAGRIYAGLLLLGAVVATVAMERALMTHDFSLAFVAANNSRSDPVALHHHRDVVGAGRIDPAVGAHPGRLHRRHGVAVPAPGRRSPGGLGHPGHAGRWPPSSSGSWPARPTRSRRSRAPSPANGLGPNVLLQDNPLVAFHPPLLYLGFVGFTIPFAFAIASLITGRIG